MYPIKKYSWIIDNNQDKLLSSPREYITSITQDKVVSAPRTSSNMVSSLEAQIESLTTLVDSIKQTCEFVITCCNDYELMKKYVKSMEGNKKRD